MSSCQTYTITNQDDANRLSSADCGSLMIRGATGALNFTRVTGQEWDTITVDSSPDLQRLEFPQVFTVKSLFQIINATSLREVMLPRVVTPNIQYSTGGSYQFEGDPFNLNITNAPKLEWIDLGGTPSNSISVGDVTLINLVSDSTANHVFDYITAALSLHIDACLYTPNLVDVGNWTIMAAVDCNYQLGALKSFGDLTMINPTHFNTYAFGDISLWDWPLVVNNSMVLRHEATETRHPQVSLDRFSHVGTSLNITSFPNTQFSFTSLTNIGTTLSISENTNCTFNFDSLLDATDLVLVDNPNTTLPLFPKLQTVNNIHLRGNIDISTGPNIFPVLTLARGKVTVEAWNADFDCSTLVSLKSQGKIHELSCNGTNNGTSNDNSRGTSGLSTGAKAGIGVGSGIFGLGIAAAILWLILQFRRRLGRLETAHRKGTAEDDKVSDGFDTPPVTGTHEVDGAGIVREMPSQHLVELHVGEPELHEDYIVEMGA